jgi:hypothetical protein
METPNPPAAGAPVARGGLTFVEGATLSLLIALAGIELVGYRYGDSNQGITVPILKRFMDPSLYKWDVMVATGDRFPTVFYSAVAPFLPGTESVPAAFFAFYVASIAAALAGVYRVGRWCGGPEAGVLALLIAIPVRVGIANEALYRVQFSHSHIASALVIWALAWFLEGRRLLPLLLLSLGAYNHVLYSVYVLVPCLLAVFVERREAGLRHTVVRVAAGTVPLVPFAVKALAERTPMTAEWLELLRLRSAHHSFPSYFGEQLAAGAFLIALGVLALSRLSLDKRRIVAVFFVGFALQSAAGTLFTEFWPVKAVLQMQPHRCWRFLMVILYGLAATGIVEGWRAGGLARASAVITGVFLANPQFEPLLPVALVLQAAFGRPTAAPWARLVAVGTLVALANWDRPHLDFLPEEYPVDTLTNPTVVAAAALAVAVAVAREASGLSRRVVAAAALAATVLWLGPTTYARKRTKWEVGAWRDVQDWVRRNTPKDAVLLTPPQEAGFRVFSERTVVGEWKDGTQQYFDSDFALEWAARMEAMGPQGFVQLPDERLAEIAHRFGADYVVIPPRRRRPGLREVYRNAHYVVYAVPGAGGTAGQVPLPARRAETR